MPYANSLEAAEISPPRGIFYDPGAQRSGEYLLTRKYGFYEDANQEVHVPVPKTRIPMQGITDYAWKFLATSNASRPHSFYDFSGSVIEKFIEIHVLSTFSDPRRDDGMKMAA